MRETFGPLPAFLILWMNLVLLTPATVAASACIFATYVLKPAFPTCEFIEIQMKLMEGDQKERIASEGFWSKSFHVNDLRLKTGSRGVDDRLRV